MVEQPSGRASYGFTNQDSELARNVERWLKTVVPQSRAKATEGRP